MSLATKVILVALALAAFVVIGTLVSKRLSKAHPDVSPSSKEKKP